MTGYLKGGGGKPGNADQAQVSPGLQRQDTCRRLPYQKQRGKKFDHLQGDDHQNRKKKVGGLIFREAFPAHPSEKGIMYNLGEPDYAEHCPGRCHVNKKDISHELVHTVFLC